MQKEYSRKGSFNVNMHMYIERTYVPVIPSVSDIVISARKRGWLINGLPKFETSAISRDEVVQNRHMFNGGQFIPTSIPKLR